MTAGEIAALLGSSAGAGCHERARRRRDDPHLSDSHPARSAGDPGQRHFDRRAAPRRRRQPRRLPPRGGDAPRMAAQPLPAQPRRAARSARSCSWRRRRSSSRARPVPGPLRDAALPPSDRLLPEKATSTARPRRHAAARWAVASLAQLGVAVYGGYFGAGIGILMLVILGFLGLTDIHAMNGLKNFFGSVPSTASPPPTSSSTAPSSGRSPS